MLECHPDLGRLLQRVAALLTIQPFCPPTEHLPNAVRLQHEGMEFWNLPVGLFCLTTHSCFKVKLNHLLTQATEKKKKKTDEIPQVEDEISLWIFAKFV